MFRWLWFWFWSYFWYIVINIKNVIVSSLEFLINMVRVILGYDVISREIREEDLNDYDRSSFKKKNIALDNHQQRLNKIDYELLKLPIKKVKFSLKDYIQERFYTDIDIFKRKEPWSKAVCDKVYANSRIGKIDFISPMIKTITLNDLYFAILLAIAVFFVTDMHRGLRYDYGNYLDPENDHNHMEDFIVGTSDDTEDEYKFNGFRMSSEWYEWVEPRAIVYQGFEKYLEKCKSVKTLYCATYNITLTDLYLEEWESTASEKDIKKQQNKMDFCLDTSYPSPQVFMTWYNKNHRYKLYKIFANALKLKQEFYHENLKRLKNFKMELTNENLNFINQYLDPKISELNETYKLIKDFLKKKYRTKEECINTLRIWQKKWYEIVEKLDLENLYDTEMGKRNREREKYHTNFDDRDISSYKIYRLRALTIIYISLYKRDIVFWKAKKEYCEIHSHPMGPIKKLALGDITFPNKCYRIWQKYKDGNFIPKEGFLRVPYLKSHLTMDVPDEHYTPNPKKPFESLKIYYYNPKEYGYSLQRDRFESSFTRLTKLELNRVNKLYGKSNFALEFERVYKPMTHIEQDKLLGERLNVQFHMQKQGLMPEDAYKLESTDFLEKKKQEELKKKLEQKLASRPSVDDIEDDPTIIFRFDFETDDDLLEEDNSKKKKI